jgi:hypothetical protein
MTANSIISWLLTNGLDFGVMLVVLWLFREARRRPPTPPSAAAVVVPRERYRPPDDHDPGYNF